MKINKKLFTKILAALLALSCVFSSLLFSSPKVSADEELDDLQQQYDDLEEKIAQNKEELNKVQGKISDQNKKLKSLNSEIESINSQINILQSRINTLNSDIAAKESSIEEINTEIETINNQISSTTLQMDEIKATMQDTRELLLGRIRENYMAGEASSLEILFSSDDISSYFTRIELMQRVSENDAELINELEDKLNELDLLQKQLESNKTELQEKSVTLEEEKAELSERQTDLQSSKSTEQSKKSEVTSKQKEVQEIINDLDEDSDEYKATIKRQEAEMEELSSQIDDYIAAHGSSVGDTPKESYENDGDMAWPVKFESYITAGYPAYSNGSAHWGIDICAKGGNTRGRAFNAAQGGEVIIAVNDGNWNYGFGNYCVIDHGDGTQTLYAHSDNIQVSVGQVVKKGEQIGIIGATGNVTGPHLHFEVRVKNSDGSVSRVNPTNYVTNPYA